MFEYVNRRSKTRLRWTFPAGIVLVASVLTLLVFAPMLWPQTVRQVITVVRTKLTVPIVADPAAPPEQKIAPKAPPRPFDDKIFRAPRVIPKDIPFIKDDETPPEIASGPTGPKIFGSVSCVPGYDCQIGQRVDRPPPMVSAPPPPVVKEAPKLAAPERIRVGGKVQEAKLIQKVTPAYPPLAKQARVQGPVRLTAIIGKDGTILDLRVLGGHPLLIPGALAAVKQWRYKPTELNGEPVEVITQIEVVFTLSQ